MVGRKDIKFTVDEYLSIPETGPRYQLIDGDLLLMTPAPTYWHQDFIAELLAILRRFVMDRRLGRVVCSPIDVYLSRHDVLQPDIAFVSNARADRIHDDGIHGAPDLVVEALSPSTRALDLGAKRVLYARHGAIEYWIADLDLRSIAVYRLGENAEAPVRTLGPGATLSTDLLPGLEIRIDDLFRR